MLAGVVGLAPGTFHTMFVMRNGNVWSTSVNSDGRNSTFEQVISGGATAAVAGNYFSIVAKKDGTVWITGKNAKGQLNFFGGTPTSRRTFTVVRHIAGVKDIAAGGYHGMLLTHSTDVWVAGWNRYGQLGDGSTEDRTSFRPVSSTGMLQAAAVAAGDSHSIVLKQNGRVWAAGRNDKGQLGDGSKTDRAHFVQVMSSGVTAVVAGGYHSMVIKQDESVWVTGWNEYGQLGDGSAIDRINYAQVVSSGAKAVAAGSRHSIMLKQGGSVWTTGYNEYGQLGHGWRNNSYVFVQVLSGGATAVAAGAFHSMVLKQDGSIWATGSNKYGQFGDGLTTSQKTFVRLAPFGNGAVGMIISHAHQPCRPCDSSSASQSVSAFYLFSFICSFAISSPQHTRRFTCQVHRWH